MINCLSIILGLHFIQSPDALKTFVSVQQEHFKFGTCDSHQNFLTADNIELHINATIFYRLVDVVTLFTARIKDETDLYHTLHSQGNLWIAATMTAIKITTNCCFIYSFIKFKYICTPLYSNVNATHNHPIGDFPR